MSNNNSSTLTAVKNKLISMNVAVQIPDVSSGDKSHTVDNPVRG